MRVRRLLALTFVAALLISCSGDDGDTAGCAPEGSFGQLAEGTRRPPNDYELGCVVLDDGESPTSVRVQVAEDEDQREIGLMGRTDMPEDAGMLFVFEEEVEGAFWMKDTLIPLSIAFIDDEGTIVDILDMQPCDADPCEIYQSSGAYSQALEVNLGAFDEWGISPGDKATLVTAAD